MGIDLGALIEHNLTPNDIIKIPKVIDSWNNIRTLKEKSIEKSDNNSNHYLKQINFKAKWREESEPTIDTLETIWKYKELEESLCTINPYQNILDTFFGEIIFYRKLALICHSPEHKYGNLQYPNRTLNLIHINREIAKRFNSRKLVYCPDSGFPTEIIWHDSAKYKNIESLIKDMNSRFFIPPKNLSDAIKHYYFIDDFSDNKLDFHKWSWQDSPWNYNDKTHKYEYKANS